MLAKSNFFIHVFSFLFVFSSFSYSQLPTDLIKSDILMSVAESRLSENEPPESIQNTVGVNAERLVSQTGYKNGHYKSFLDEADKERYVFLPLSNIELIYESILDKSFSYQIRIEVENLNSLKKINNRLNELRFVSFLNKPKEEIQALQLEKDQLLQKRDLLEIERRKHAIRQFGYTVFKTETENISTFEGVPPDYILGPGDQLTAYIWGKIEQSLDLELDRNGRVYISRIGHVPLMGIKFSDAAKVLTKELESEFVNFNLSVSMKKLKSISVFILGDVEQPGRITVPSTSSIFQLLFAVGGPSKNGTLRDIKVIRNGKIIKTIDFYDYLLLGKNNSKVTIQNNDTIFVPSIKNTVLVNGAINRPSIYEFSKKLTLDKLLQLAGGYSLNSSKQRLQIVRYNNIGNQEVIDIDSLSGDFKKNIKKTFIKNGDVVNVFSVTDRVNNYVQVEGNVLRPGRYSFTNNLTLKDMIKKSAGLDEDTYMERVDIYRFVSVNKRRIVSTNLLDEEALNTPIFDKDIIRFYSRLDALGTSKVTVSGAVREPGEYKLLEGMKVSDAVFLAKLDLFADQGVVEIFRREVSKPPKLITVPLYKVLIQPNSLDNIVLMDKDQINVKLDANALKTRSIVVEGEVRFPGTYIAREGESLSSILERAGGFTDNAFLLGAVFTRVSSKEKQVFGQRTVINDEKKKVIYDQSHLSSITMDSKQAYEAVLASREKALIVLEEQIDAHEGRIILNLKSLDMFKGSLSDLEIEDGDKINIPEFPESVHLVGGVKNPSSVVYKNGENGRFYVDQVGGFSSYAVKNNIYIFKPNGSVINGLRNIEAGDIIYVPEEVKIKVNWLQFIGNIADILGKTATAVATVKVLQGD